MMQTRKILLSIHNTVCTLENANFSVKYKLIKYRTGSLRLPVETGRWDDFLSY